MERGGVSERKGSGFKDLAKGVVLYSPLPALLKLCSSGRRGKNCFPLLLRTESSMVALMSAAGQPWTQISSHAVKSDPHESTPYSPVQYPQLKYRRPACHFVLNQDEELSRRGPC